MAKPRNKFEAKFLELHPTFEYEKHKLQYEIVHTYTPDFYDKETGKFYETKGRFTGADRTKHLNIKRRYPRLDLTIVFMNPNTPIRKGSKTTYADWCDKHGIKWTVLV